MKTPIRMPIRVVAGILALALALSIGGCGRKPADLLPPEGSEGENYPRTYPSS